MAVLIIIGAGFGLFALIRWAANEPSLTYGQRDLHVDYLKAK